jgi:hypothetical protein
MSVEYRIRLVTHRQDVMVADEDQEITWHVRRAVEIAHRQPEMKQWRTDCLYLYASPSLAQQEAWAMVGMYLQNGIPVEHNLSRLEVSHGTG